MKGLVAILSVALLYVAAAPMANADPWNKKTIVTLNDSLEIPGMVLDPGTYVFQLAESQSNRHIVQIWTEDGQHLITTILAVPAYRQRPSDESVFDLDERPADAPMALRTWFYPGDNAGQEFVYDYRYDRRYNNEQPYESGIQDNQR
jgi:hypothetical protein